jgi:SpoVK/Ycf46/Vps4 family AAA+-type ATPase
MASVSREQQQQQRRTILRTLAELEDELVACRVQISHIKTKNDDDAARPSLATRVLTRALRAHTT